ncbi:MAG: DNA internalization-related competence protein ComEC/Rec2 [Steroidobacteraceae bacterium]
MFLFALAFGAGVAALHASPALPSWPVLACVALAAVLCRRHTLVVGCCAGLAWTAIASQALLAVDWPCSRDGETIDLVGIVAGPAIRREGRTDFDLDPVTRELPRRVRLAWYEAAITPLPGQVWRLAARLRCRNGLANPGAADRELDLLRQRIGATGYIAAKGHAELLADPPARRPIQRLRARIAADIVAPLPAGASSAVLQGLAVGVRGNVPDTLWDAFAATGVAHLMAISGLHVTGCALVVLFLLRGFWRMPRMATLPARVGIEILVVMTAVAGYALLAGASVPALRTLAMVGVVALQRLLRRSLPMHRSLALAALILVAIDPLALSSAGFWLSFVATAALIAIVEAGPGWRARIVTFARAQLAVTALLTPVLVAVFGRLSLISPLVNAAAIPAFTCLLLPVVLFGTVLDALLPGSAAEIWRGLAAALDRLWPLLVSMADWRLAAWAPAAQPGPVLFAAGLATLAALLAPVSGLRLAAAAMLLATTCGDAARPPRDSWTLTVVDAGQGLAAVVETRGHVLVFDTGPRWRGGGPAARVSLLPYLRSRGIRRIDRLVVSHADMDHAGGVELLRRSFDIGSTIGAVTGQDARAAHAMCRRGDGWRWDGVRFQVLHPPVGWQGNDNDRSCALLVRSHGGAALLLADPEGAAEQALLASPLAADVVLLPHHGSKSSSSPELVAAAGARLGIASAGFGNRWGMPAAAVVARWRAGGTTILNTADAGAVSVRFAARRAPIEVTTERGSTRHWWRRPPG